MTNKFMRKREKIRAQMKSRFYYWFWGAATVMVVSGQFYVGSGSVSYTHLTLPTICSV